MKTINKSTVWLIMSTDRKKVAKGTPRNRCLINVDDKKDKKRYLTYSSKRMAEAAFGNGLGFYNNQDNLEAVECEMVIKVKQ